MVAPAVKNAGVLRPARLVGTVSRYWRNTGEDEQHGNNCWKDS